MFVACDNYYCHANNNGVCSYGGCSIKFPYGTSTTIHYTTDGTHTYPYPESVRKYTEHDINAVKEVFSDYMNKGRKNGKTNGDYWRHLPPIKKVIFNNPATIVFWDDGTKTVVKKSDKDVWDPEKGLAMAIVKKLFTRSKFLKMIPKDAWEGESDGMDSRSE